MAPYLSADSPKHGLSDRLDDISTIKSKLKGASLREKPSQFQLQLSAELESFCKTHKITPHQILLAAWAITFRSYTASEVVTIGDLVLEAGGKFCNAVYEVELDDDLTLHQIVQQLQQPMHSGEDGHALLTDNHAAPNNNVEVTTIFVQRPSRHIPIRVDMPFNLQSCQNPLQRTLTIDVIRDWSVEKVDLSIFVSKESENQVTNMLRTFQQVVAEMLLNPTGKVGDLELCGHWDRTQLSTWNDKGADRTPARCVHTLIHEQCAGSPLNTAVQAWDGTITYGQLDKLSSDLASKLADTCSNIGPETFVPLCLEKSKWAVVAMLAIMKIGAAFVLLDPEHPEKRLKDISQQVRATVIVSSPQTAIKCKNLASHVIVVDDNFQLAPHFPGWAQPLVHPSNVLYAGFVSTPTSAPKGILVEHGSFIASARAYIKSVNLNQTSRVLQTAGCASNMSIRDILYSLLVGATICVPSEEECNSTLTESIGRLQPNWAHFAPFSLQSLSPADLPSLKTVVFNGERISSDIVSKWESHVRLINVYGPAECSLQSTLQLAVSTDPCNIGRATTGATWIVSRSNHNHLMPIGAIGELVIEGSHVGRGYINDLSATREAFIHSSAWLWEFRNGHSPLYKTGDLVRYETDGSLRYIGRKNAQANIDGQQFELADVEHHVRQCFPPGTAVITEVIFPDNEGDKPTLAAFVQHSYHGTQQQCTQASGALFGSPSTSFRAKSKAVREQLARSIPQRMIPTVFFPIARLPLTTAGKTDRKLLQCAAHALSKADLKLYTAAIETPPAVASPCIFPVLTDGLLLATAQEVETLESVDIVFDPFSDINRWCDIHGFTLSRLFQVSWGILLRQYTNSDHVCFGFSNPDKQTQSGRTEHFSVFTCSMDLPEGKSIVDLLEQNQDSFPCASSDQNSSFLDKTLSGEQLGLILFNTVLSIRLQQGSESTIDKKSTTGRTLDKDDTSKYAISVNIEHLHGNIRACLSFWSTALSSWQAHNIATTFSHIISAIVASSTSTIGSLSCFSSAHKSEVMTWNRDPSSRAECCIQDLIRRRCKIQRQALAICSWDGNVTYEQLDDLSTRLATKLVEAGVVPETFVPLCFEKSRWASVAMLGILKAGGALVLLDPSHPIQQLHEICQETKSALILSSDQNFILSKQLSNKVILVNGDVTAWPKNDVLLNAVQVTPRNAMYSIFAPGDNGKPEGIVFEHSSFTTSARAHSAAFGLDTRSRVLQCSPPSLDAALIETLTTLAVGGCICIPQDSIIEASGDVSGMISKLNPNWILMTPSLVKKLEPSQLPSIKTMIVGGDPIEITELKPWCDKLQMIIAYGPRACSTFCAGTSTIQPDSDPRNLGYGLSTAFWIVDQNDSNKLAPVGSIGELVIEGPSVCREYLNKPEKTVAAFLDSPPWLYDFRWDTRARLYKTGDLVQYAPDGSIRFVGRKDMQAKLRGQHIDIGEIEHHLRQNLPESVDLVVETMFSCITKTHVLVAFVCSSDRNIGISQSIFKQPTERFQLSARSARSRLLDTVPSYKVPDFIIEVCNIPLGPTRTSFRKTLQREAEALGPEELLDLGVGRGWTRPPANRIERRLQHLIGQVLGLPPSRVGMDESFFHIGGDLSSATKLVELAQMQNLGLTLKSVVEHSWIAALASALRREAKSLKAHIPPFSLLGDNHNRILQEILSSGSIQEQDIEDIYLCTPRQKDMLAQNSPSYTHRYVYKLPTSVDILRFESAWHQVVAASPILRTRIFHASSGIPHQVVMRQNQGWITHDRLESYLAQDATIPVASMDPLIKTALVYQGRTRLERYLCLTVHDILFDGWSEHLLLKRIESAYKGERLQSNPFVPFVKQIADASLHSENFWRAEFSDCKAVTFPSLPNEHYLPSPDASLSKTISLNRGHQNGFTLNSQIQLAWAIVISQYTASEDVVFGVMVNGRDSDVTDIESVIGPTAATVPLRVRVNQCASIGENLRDVQDRFVQMMPFEQFGLRNISVLSENASVACRFQSLLVVETQPVDYRWNIFSRLISPSHREAFGPYPLTLRCSPQCQTVDLECIFDAHVIPENMMERILNQFVHVFEQIAVQFFTPVQDINAINPNDLKQLIEWNGDAPPQQTMLVHELIKRQCSVHMETQAVSAWDGDLTYHQLDDLTSKLAASLNSLGVRAEVIVPLCFEKSKWTTVAMLGVMKAGGAFVLLDPSSQPIQRMADMCQEVSASLVLASAKHACNLQGLGYDIVTLSDDEPVWATDIQDWQPPVVTKNNAVYVVFTSGSTGKPKGITIEHAGFASSACANKQVLGLDSKSRVLQFSSYAFDVCIENNLTTLIAGGCVCVPSESDCKGDLATAAQNFQVTYADLTPSVARILEPHDMPTVNTVILGGEAMAAEDVSRWSKKVQLVNAYGPAECSVTATIQPDVALQPNPANIGRGYAAKCWIVDRNDHTKLLPIGAVGELVIEGPIVGRGYLNRRNGASPVFIEDCPDWMHTIRRGKSFRMYKTGDLAQYNLDGTLNYIGRKDLQVKLNGQRIELGEVETHVRHYFRAARDVIVQVVTHIALGNHPRLVAFVWQDMPQDSDCGTAQSSLIRAPDNFFRQDVKDAEEQLRKSIPNYMVPTTFIPLASLPLAASGKADRKLLREKVLDLSREQLRSYAPLKEKKPVSTATERKIQAIWARILNINPSEISADDSFFQIGGYSIAAMKVVTAGKVEGIHISLPELFQNASLEKLARGVDSRTSTSNGSMINWENEVTLCANMTAPVPKLVHRPTRTKMEVILTGSTGFLGREILKQLIDNPCIARIHCIAIRANGQGVARKSNLISDKILTYPGDLSVPRLGLSEEDESKLTEICDVIIHCGALVSFVQGYQTMCKANVESTKQLTRWALKRFIPFHYVSTAGVSRHLGAEEVFHEESVAAFPPPGDGAEGYAASKWTSEVYLERVNAKFGLPIYIHRPTNIVGPGTSDVDVVNSLLKYSRLLKKVPRLDNWTGFFDLIRLESVASDVVCSVTEVVDTENNDCYPVKYIHEAGEIVMPTNKLKDYLMQENTDGTDNADGSCGTFEEIDMKAWIEAAKEAGINEHVVEYLVDLQDSGTGVALALVMSSRLTNGKAIYLQGLPQHL
ncbi:NRPS [Myotisia sp. PD_48]|nr:NRPS [Myotisia sp. PD_48]